MTFDIETILEWQQRGMAARMLGVSKKDNPIGLALGMASCPKEKDGWLQKAEAWTFGWNIENAMRTF